MATGEKKSGGGKVVLVGTYKGDQLTKWRGWYNYPISDSDFSRVEHVERVYGRAQSPVSPERSEPRKRSLEVCAPQSPADYSCINELWLFNGTKDERRYRAEFVGVKTRQELIDDYGYLAWENSRRGAEAQRENPTRSTRSTRPNSSAKPHATHYALFKTQLLYRHKLDVPEDAEAVIIRLSDFAKRSPKIARQLKAYLESPDRRDPDLAKRLPEVITKLRPAQLHVCENHFFNMRDYSIYIPCKIIFF